MPIWELGGTAYDALGRRASQCVVSTWILKRFPIELERLFIIKDLNDPNPCLSCPLFELIEQFVLGGLTREMLKVAYEMEKQVDNNKEVDYKKIMVAFNAGLKAGVLELVTALKDSQERLKRNSEPLFDYLLKVEELKYSE